MRLLALAAICLLGAAPAPAPVNQGVERAGEMPIIVPAEPGRADCPATAAALARQRGDKPEAQRLGDLPGADAYAAVLRQVDGCEAPLVVSYDIGGRSPATALREGR